MATKSKSGTTAAKTISVGLGRAEDPFKPTIFIASSTRAKPLADALADKLKLNLNVRPWFNTFASSARSIMAALLQQCSECDFAAVFLTRDDTRTKSDNTDAVPRDNCIYELGLFTGALGLDIERSFVLTSVSSDALPTDLAGVRLIEITEPATFTKTSCAKCMSEAAQQILAETEKWGHCLKRPLLEIIPAPLLIARERPVNAGGRYFDSDCVEVVVNSTQPIELDPRLAKIVSHNLISDVSYTYFFEPDVRSIRFFSALISRLASGLLDRNWKEVMNADKLRQLMKKDEAGVDRLLNSMRSQLRIYFVAHRPQLEFCVHNANHLDEAICYLRNSNNSYIEWSRGENAKYMADELKTDRFPAGDLIFQGSAGFDLYGHQNRDFLNALVETTARSFPDGRLRTKALEVCFGYHAQ